jgi:hypothetical protein
MILPNEKDDRIQEILASDTTIERKAYRIEGYYESKLTYNRVRGRAQPKPVLNYIQIKEELEKRGDNLAPVEIQL